MTRALRPALVAGLALLLAGAGMTWTEGPRSFAAQGGLVDDVPVLSTPAILEDPELSGDERVNAIAKVGGTIILGGEFSEICAAGYKEDRCEDARPEDEPWLYSRTSLVALDAKTHEVVEGFAPVFHAPVDALVPAAGGDAVFVGGQFNSVNGDKSRDFLVKLKVPSGEIVTSFDPPSLNGQVRDLAVRDRDGRLYVAGDFEKVGGARHPGMVALNPQTGDVVSSFDVAFRGNQHDGGTNVRAFAISPDGNRLVAVGNFGRVDGSIDGNSQNGRTRTAIAMIDLSGPTAELVQDWRTTRFQAKCSIEDDGSSAFYTYMRDVEFSPDGSYFVVVTTGGPEAGTLCDAASRWATAASGRDVQPTWVAHTGGDTLTEVAITDSAIYVGGHQKWFNNPRGVDGRSGAVPRPGLAALDPRNGLPLDWNPGRIPRGYGVLDMLVTERGLWIGMDTEWIGGRNYHTGRAAFFPYDGGSPVPRTASDKLPGNVYMMGDLDLAQQVVNGSAKGNDAVAYRWYDGTVVGESGTVPAGGFDESSVRGAVLIGEKLWYGSTDGELHWRSFDGKTFGPEKTPNPYEPEGEFPGDEERPRWPGEKSDFYDQIDRVTGLFYTNGRLYYTLAGRAKLYYRYFTPSSAIVGAKHFVAGTAVRWPRSRACSSPATICTTRRQMGPCTGSASRPGFRLGTQPRSSRV